MKLLVKTTYGGEKKKKKKSPKWGVVGKSGYSYIQEKHFPLSTK